MSGLLRQMSMVLLPVALIAAVGLLVNAYTGTGDGFSAGVVAALGVLARYATIGARRAHRQVRADWMPRIALGGLALLLVVGLWPAVVPKEPLVTHLPPPGAHVIKLGSLELHTAIAFDVGLGLLVFGTLVRMVDHFSRAMSGGEE